MEWYFWLGIYVGAILVYLSIGRFIMWSLKKVSQKDAWEEIIGSSRLRVWGAAILWPLFIVIVILETVRLPLVIVCSVVGFISALLLGIIIFSPTKAFDTLRDVRSKSKKEK
jgi:hypothetical protein